MQTTIILISVNVVFASCVTLNLSNQRQTLNAKRRIELKPYEIECQLTDMVIISAPVVKRKDVLYYINKPNGEVKQLHLPVTNSIHDLAQKDEYDHVEADFIGDQPAILNHKDKYTIFNVNFGQTVTTPDSKDVFKEKFNSLLANEFMIGPLGYEDHGNWVLSMYYKDGLNWTEVFQVISILIIEKSVQFDGLKHPVSASKRFQFHGVAYHMLTTIFPEGIVRDILKPQNIHGVEQTLITWVTNPSEPATALPRERDLKTGDTFELMFAYPIPYLERCQLTAPVSSFDRFYDRSRIRLSQCAYVVRNVTMQDAGTWTIVAVGKIVYEAIVFLTVKPRN